MIRYTENGFRLTARLRQERPAKATICAAGTGLPPDAALYHVRAMGQSVNHSTSRSVETRSSGIRTRVSALKGPRPRPLDDGDTVGTFRCTSRSVASSFTEPIKCSQEFEARQRVKAAIATRRRDCTSGVVRQQVRCRSAIKRKRRPRAGTFADLTRGPRTESDLPRILVSREGIEPFERPFLSG
jgi:hypothetical protein